MSRAAITEPYWHALCLPIREGHNFGPLHDTIVAISELPTRFPTLFSQHKTDMGKITAAHVFNAMAELATAIYETHPELETYHVYFAILNEIWPAGLASDRFKILQDNKATLEGLSAKHFGHPSTHPAVTSPATYGYTLLRAFFNHMLIDGNFNAFKEIRDKWAITRNFFFKNFKTDANTAIAVAAMTGCQNACRSFFASLSTAGKSKVTAENELRASTTAAVGETFHTRSAVEPTGDATVVAASQNVAVSTLILFSASTGMSSDPRSAAELFRVFRARSMINDVHHYLQQREEEIETAATGYSAEDYQARTDSFDSIKQEIQKPHITDLHNTLIAIFIQNQARRFSGWIPGISRTEYAKSLQPLIRALQDTSTEGLCLRHFQAALRQIEAEASAVAQADMTQSTPRAPKKTTNT